MKRILIVISLTLGLGLSSLACSSAAPGGISVSPGSPAADIWIAGDSVAGGVHYYLRTPGIYNAAKGGNGFLHQLEGTIPTYALERLALPAAFES